MLLLVEIGNTSLKLAVKSDHELNFLATIYYKETDYLSELEKHLEALSQPNKVLLASVANEKMNNTVITWMKERFDDNIEKVRVEDNTHGLQLAYSDVSRLGVDRWLIMLAAKHISSSAFCVISCGTAMTVDTVSEDGKHLGGLIIPGRELMQQALVEKTAACQISKTNLTAELSLFGKSTEQCISHGGLYANVSLINAVFDELNRQNDFSFFITGGDSPAMKPYISEKFIFKTDLLFEGLSRFDNQSVKR